jgi:hypothetical protein
MTTVQRICYGFHKYFVFFSSGKQCTSTFASSYRFAIYNTHLVVNQLVVSYKMLVTSGLKHGPIMLALRMKTERKYPEPNRIVFYI